jgi:two-component system cell cycle sensor histidine kinase/response regulator CckA
MELSTQVVNILHGITDAFFVVDHEWRFVYLNPQADQYLRQLGKSRSELIGKNMWEEFPTDVRSEGNAQLRKAMVEQLPVRYESYSVPLGLWFEIHAFPSSEGLSVFVRDITQRKDAEEALRISEEKYRTLFEESPDGIFMSTPDGKLLDVNPAGVRLLGYASREELLERDIVRDIYVKPQDREMFKRTLTRQGYIQDYEFMVRRADGEVRIVQETATAVRDELGNVVAYRGFVRDVTDRKRLEEQLRQAQKMEGIGTLAGGVAHDFNNLLGIIIGYASLLESKNNTPERTAQSVDTIKKAAQRGADLVQQLLTFARKSEPSFSSVDVNATVREIVRMLTQTFPKTIAIDSTLAENIPPIIADSSQLHQALLNLCVNSRDAMSTISGRAAGTLMLETGRVDVHQLRRRFSDAMAEVYVFIRVGDTGVGMDEVTRTRIFEPFFTTKELGKGTGLGLSVVYGVVKSHHAQIDVESEPGKGTVITLYFPADPSAIVASAESTPNAAEDASNGKGTILLVEDESMLLDLLHGVLQDHGYTVLTARDGQEGVEVYKSNVDQIALVLSDMGLPKLGGWEMFLRMKELNPGVKVILASGFFDPKLKTEMLTAGAIDFIQKPYVTEAVLGRIREVLQPK